MVATTTTMHRVTGTNSMMTCLAPYFKVSSSSSSSSASTTRAGRAAGGCPFCSGPLPLPLPLPSPPPPPPSPPPPPPLDLALVTVASWGCRVGSGATLVSCWSLGHEKKNHFTFQLCSMHWNSLNRIIQTHYSYAQTLKIKTPQNTEKIDRAQR